MSIQCIGEFFQFSLDCFKLKSNHFPMNLYQSTENRVICKQREIAYISALMSIGFWWQLSVSSYFLPKYRMRLIESEHSRYSKCVANNQKIKIRLRLNESKSRMLKINHKIGRQLTLNNNINRKTKTRHITITLINLHVCVYFYMREFIIYYNIHMRA